MTRSSRRSKSGTVACPDRVVRLQIWRASGEFVRILESASLLDAVKALERLRDLGYRVSANRPSGRASVKPLEYREGIAIARNVSQVRQGGGNKGDGNQSGKQGGSQGSSKQSGRAEGGSASQGSSERGFAGMDPAKQREIAAEGGRAAHASGNAHEFSSEEAREAGAGREPGKQAGQWQAGQ
jgi:hypothetical protein